MLKEPSAPKKVEGSHHLGFKLLPTNIELVEELFCTVQFGLCREKSSGIGGDSGIFVSGSGRPEL